MLLTFVSGTQTDESDDDERGTENNGQTSIDVQLAEAQQELEATRAHLQLAQAELRASKNELQACKVEATAANARAIQLKQALNHANQELDSSRERTAAQLQVHRFGLERFSSDDDSIKFYTGFPSYQHILLFYNFLKPTAEKMTYCYASGILESRPTSRAMQLIDEMFMFLVRIKLGLFEQDLAHRFLLHISSVSRKITTWANYLYFLLGTQPIWPSRSQINQSMPEEFQKLYPTTRVILDCTEIFVQTPSSLLLQSQLYSSYKSNTTLKGLVGIAPHGAITFVSSLYTGAISDKEITRCSGILELLEPNDSVMADKGFDIEDMLRVKGVGLNLPPYLQNRGQFSARQVHETKTIAKLRIHVERAIRRIKEFHIFDSDIPLSTLGSINQIYTVACLLTNFQGPLILKAASASSSTNN